jgi:hypothetical protein
MIKINLKALLTDVTRIANNLEPLLLIYQRMIPVILSSDSRTVHYDPTQNN